MNEYVVQFDADFSLISSFRNEWNEPKVESVDILAFCCLWHSTSSPRPCQGFHLLPLLLLFFPYFRVSLTDRSFLVISSFFGRSANADHFLFQIWIINFSAMYGAFGSDLFVEWMKFFATKVRNNFEKAKQTGWSHLMRLLTWWMSADGPGVLDHPDELTSNFFLIYSSRTNENHLWETEWNVGHVWGFFGQFFERKKKIIWLTSGGMLNRWPIGGEEPPDEGAAAQRSWRKCSVKDARWPFCRFISVPASSVFSSVCCWPPLDLLVWVPRPIFLKIRSENSFFGGIFDENVELHRRPLGALFFPMKKKRFVL
jgi:hypothetical protein